MRLTIKRIHRKLKKDPKSLITLGIKLAVIVILFITACLNKIYTSTNSILLQCDSNKCVIIKEDVLGNKTAQYTFDQAELNSVGIKRQKNILNQQTYHVILKNKNSGKEYQLSKGSRERQYAYLGQINEFLNNSGINKTLYLKTTRGKFKFIVLATTGVSALILLLLIIDCIKELIKFRKRQKRKKYDDIINPDGSR